MGSPLLFGVSFIFVMSSVFGPSVYADSFDDQINQLNQKNNQSAQSQQQLRGEAGNLAESLAALQAEIAALDGQMRGTQTNIDKLQRDIARVQHELSQQRELLNASVRQLYVKDHMGTLEMLASSKNMSHFIDRKQYYIKLQQKIDTAMARIEKLMHQLEQEKKQADQLLADQRAMQDRLSTQRAENDRLLHLNSEQQQAFDRDIAANNAQVAKLRQEQAAENAKGFVGKIETKAPPKTEDTYPWANVPFPNTLPDPWGMYKRQCVSYTAWKVANSGRHMPYWGGRGDAKKWDDNARREGIPVDKSPRVGDIAVSNAGTYGHVMYVEAVHGDGTISISQYNAGWSGSYSEGRRSTANLVFIHF